MKPIAHKVPREQAERFFAKLLDAGFSAELEEEKGRDRHFRVWNDRGVCFVTRHEFADSPGVEGVVIHPLEKDGDVIAPELERLLFDGAVAPG